MAGALDGIRVLELARYQAGPRGGMILSDLGAEVIKIEKLGGEETRKSEPMVRGQSVYFTVYNRGKKSLCLDMRTERGKEIFAALVPTADIVLQNFRPGVMEKMGFGYDRLRAAEAGHHPVFGVRVRAIRPLSRPPGLRSAGAGDERADEPDRRAGRDSRWAPPPRWSTATPRCTRRSARWRRCATATAPARARWSIAACWIPAFTMVEIPLSYYLATGQEGGEGGRPPYKCKDGYVVISASGRAMATRLIQIATGNKSASVEGWTSRVGRGRPAQGGGGEMVRREHRRPHRLDPARGRNPGRAGQDDPAGRRGPASLGARDAGQDAGRARRRDPRARRDDQDVEDAGPRRPCADPGEHTDEVLSWLLGYDQATLRELREAKVMGSGAAGPTLPSAQAGRRNPAAVSGVTQPKPQSPPGNRRRWISRAAA